MQDVTVLCSFDYMGSTFTVYVDNNGAECVCDGFDSSSSEYAYEYVDSIWSF